MIIGTHLLMADLLYKHILSKIDFEIDYPSFAYGNIIPDLNKRVIGKWHTVPHSLNMVNKYAESLAKHRLTAKEFSLALGIICHFVCDYFCLYHGKRYWKKDKLGHGVYEVLLHIRLWRLYLRGDVKFYCINSSAQNIEDVVMLLQKKYNSGASNATRDITFALTAAASASKLIINNIIEKTVK